MNHANHSGTDGKAGGAPLILLPGTLCDARVFAPLIDRLPNREALVLDFAGETDVRCAAKRILAAVPPQFALLGFSLGGIIALEIAALVPERVLGLALVASNARDIRPEFHAGRRRDAMQGAADLDYYIREVMWPRYVSPDHLEDLQLQDLIAAMANDGGAKSLIDQTEIGLSRIDSLDRLSSLTLPSLILAGSDDKLCTPEMQNEMAARMPSATLAILPRAGHFVTLENPSDVAAHVAAWLDSVDDLRAGPLK